MADEAVSGAPRKAVVDWAVGWAEAGSAAQVKEGRGWAVRVKAAG